MLALGPQGSRGEDPPSPQQRPGSVPLPGPRRNPGSAQSKLRLSHSELVNEKLFPVLEQPSSSTLVNRGRGGSEAGAGQETAAFRVLEAGRHLLQPLPASGAVTGPRNATLCHAVLCHAMPCRAVPCRAVPAGGRAGNAARSQGAAGGLGAMSPCPGSSAGRDKIWLLRRRASRGLVQRRESSAAALEAARLALVPEHPAPAAD